MHSAHIEWVAELQGEALQLQTLAALFPGPPHHIFGREGAFYLRSTSFDGLTTHIDVSNAGDLLLRWACSLLHLFSNLRAVVTVVGTRGCDAAGRITCSSIGASGTATVYNPDGIAQLSAHHGDTTFAMALIQAAAADSAVSEVLDSIGTQNVSWRDLYVLMDLLGGPRQIAKRGWASESLLRNIQQVANHHRHAKARQRQSLPSVSLEEARHIVFPLLRRWLQERATQSG
jgi:hypothetical protein